MKYAKHMRTALCLAALTSLNCSGEVFLEVEPIAVNWVLAPGINEQTMGEGRLRLWFGFVHNGKNVIAQPECRIGSKLSPNICDGSLGGILVTALQMAISRKDKIRLCGTLNPTGGHPVNHYGKPSFTMSGISYGDFWMYMADVNEPLDRYVRQPCYRWVRHLNTSTGGVKQ